MFVFVFVLVIVFVFVLVIVFVFVFVFVYTCNKSVVPTHSTFSHPNSPPTSLLNGVSVLFLECIALYAYNGEAGDLNFKEGDVISITKSDGDWWEGVLNGQKGIFPANYVKRKEPEVLLSDFMSLRERNGKKIFRREDEFISYCIICTSLDVMTVNF